MGIIDALREQPLVAIVVVLSIVAAAILKYSLRRPRKGNKPTRSTPKKKRRR